MNKDIYPSWAVYTDGKIEDVNFIDVCKSSETLTFDRRYLKKGYVNRTYSETPFKEIKLLLPSEKTPNEWKHVFHEDKVYDEGFDFIVKKLRQSLKDCLERNWDSNKKHLFTHSSGYDSRILSGLLAELRDENGRDWLGHIHFRCHQPEGPGFEQIMKIEGWKPDEYSNYAGPNLDHYDLGNTKYIPNGWMSYVGTLNFWRDIIPYNEEKNWVIVTGLGGGEMFSYPPLDLKPPNRLTDICQNPRLQRYLNYFPDRGINFSYLKTRFKDIIAPYYDYGYLETCGRTPITLAKIVKKPLDNFRHALIKSINPKLFNVKWFKHNYNFEFSPNRVKLMKEHYRTSKLCRHFPEIKNLDPTVRNKFNDKLYAFSLMYEKIMR